MLIMSCLIKHYNISYDTESARSTSFVSSVDRRQKKNLQCLVFLNRRRHHHHHHHRSRIVVVVTVDVMEVTGRC